MNLESWLLAAVALAALGLLLVALAMARRDRSLRSRLVLVFVTLALSPALLTLVFLWRELAPRTRLGAAQGMERSLESALVLARRVVTDRHAEALVLARHAAARASGSVAPAAALDSLAPGPYAAMLLEPSTHRVLALHAGWAPEQARAFLEQPAVRWPAYEFPAELVRAPDSSPVVVATAPLRGSKPVRIVLVALPLDATQAEAVVAVVEGVQHAQRFGFLEELKLQTVARLLGGFAIASVSLAMLLAFLLARTLTRPIEGLRRAFEAVAAGETGHQVEIGSARDGEMGRLLLGFNAMSRELEESKKELVRAARLAAWRDVARRLAHEIKNPLTPITLSIHRLRRRTPAGESVVHECLDTILAETSHLERLANEFSSFARLPKPERCEIEPAPVLQQVLDLYSAHPDVRVHADLHGMPRVVADRDQLRQVFTNLVKNAVEAMPGGGDVLVQWDRPNGELRVTFSDSGSGFAPPALEHLFDPTFTTKPGGSGLGLAIVRRILDDHGGSIEVGNRPQGGAWVRIGLPTASGRT